jgi:sugar phosphate permease
MLNRIMAGGSQSLVQLSASMLSVLAFLVLPPLLSPSQKSLAIDLYQWRTTLAILGLGIWAIGIPLAFVIRNKPEQYGYLPDGEVSGTSGQIQQIQALGSEIGFREALKMRTFLYLNLAEAIRMMTIMAVFTHVRPYLGSVGMPRTTASMVAVTVPLIGIIGRSAFG